MKLYTLTGASGVSNEDYGDFDVDEDGSIEVPEAFGVLLRDSHIGGVKAWEDEIERFHRLAAEDVARRKDPATLLATVEKLVEQQQAAKPARARARKPAAPSA
jgi:hypothetical protein